MAASWRSRSMHIPRTRHFVHRLPRLRAHALLPHAMVPTPSCASRARLLCHMYRLPPSSLRGCAAPWDSVCACPFLRARAFPRFCFRVHSGLYYDGSAFCRPAPYRETAHVMAPTRRTRRTLHPLQVSSGRLRMSRGPGASPFCPPPRGPALRTSTSGTSSSSRGTCIL